MMFSCVQWTAVLRLQDLKHKNPVFAIDGLSNHEAEKVDPPSTTEKVLVL